MARNPRIHFDGAVYHVMARGVDARDVFVDVYDRKNFLAVLKRIEKELSAHVMAYCLMGNHFHLAIRVGHIPLSAIMQRLLTRYALEFNRRHGRTGHLFQARYKAKVCVAESYLTQLIHYIHMNPVRAGLVSSAQDWPWSSLPRSPASRQVVDLLGFDPWGDAAAGSLVRAEPRTPRSLRELEETICRNERISPQDLRAGNYDRNVVSARRQFTQEAIREGHRLVAIARWLGSAKSSISRYAMSKVELQRLTPKA